MADAARKAVLSFIGAAQAAQARLAARAGAIALRMRGRKTVELLLISDGLNYTSEQQLAPFRRHAAELRKRLGLIVRFMPVEQARNLSATALARYDIIVLKFSFRADLQASLALSRRIRSAIEGTETRLVCFDGDDDLNILWPELVKLSDIYVKKHVYRNRADYAVPRIGKSNLTDFVAREHGVSFADNEITHSRPLDLTYADNIIVGWNIGLDDKIADLAARMQPGTEPRPVDVCSRAFVKPEVWIFPLRDVVAQRLEAMASRMNVLIPRNRVAQDEYYAEMRSSKICVSPFGYGELCWRDFEAILCGCLLVKPDMSHIETLPDIFVPGVTYVPVKWDYSDLEEVCARYLADDEARGRIVRQAYETVKKSLTADWFVARVQATLSL
jgi:hypothetical protein